jgi:Asp/Glu/hydantoin racemase
MGIRILFINPNGTDIYDEHTASILGPVASSGTEVVVRSLHGVPKMPFLCRLPSCYKQLFETIVDAEKEGFDGVVIGCAGDPGLKEAKRLASIPVTAPFEAAARTAPAFGPFEVIARTAPAIGRFSVIGGGNEAWNLANEYGVIGHLASVRRVPLDRPSVEESLRLLEQNPDELRRLTLGAFERAVHGTAMEQAKRAVYEDGATVLFFGCTLWAGMLEPIARAVPATVLDPVITPLKYIELLATAGNYYSARRQG